MPVLLDVKLLLTRMADGALMVAVPFPVKTFQKSIVVLPMLPGGLPSR
jgi:hypothetical protein